MEGGVKGERREEFVMNLNLSLTKINKLTTNIYVRSCDKSLREDKLNIKVIKGNGLKLEM